MDSSPRSLPPSSRRPLFDTLVGSSNALRIFLEFCSAYDGSGRGDGGSRDGDAWTSLIMFWLDAEHYRQLVGDADAMERHGLKIWDDYLDSSDGEDGSGLAAADPVVGEGKQTKLRHFRERLGQGLGQEGEELRERAQALLEDARARPAPHEDLP